MPFVENVAAIVFAPLVRYPMFPTPLGHVFALDPDVLTCRLLISPIPRGIDVTLADRRLFDNRGRRRIVDFNRSARRLNGKRNGERTSKCDCQERFTDINKDSLLDCAVPSCRDRQGLPIGGILEWL